MEINYDSKKENKKKRNALVAAVVIVVVWFLLIGLLFGLYVLPNYGYTRAQLKDEMTVDVGSASALAEALRVNSQTKNQKVTIRLTKDIVLSQKDRDRITSQGAVFYGVLDGNGHGIICDDAADQSELFTLNGSLSDLSLSGCTLIITQEKATERLSLLHLDDGKTYYGSLASFLVQAPTVPQGYESFVGWYVADAETGKVLLTEEFAEGEYALEAVFARRATFTSALTLDEDSVTDLSAVNYYSSDLFGAQELPAPKLGEQNGWLFDGWWVNGRHLPMNEDTGKTVVTNADLAGTISARWVKSVAFDFAESALGEVQASLPQEDRILLPQTCTVAYGESFLPAAPQNVPQNVTFEGYCYETISQTGEILLQDYAAESGCDGSFDRLLAKFSINAFLVISGKAYSVTLPYYAATESVDLSAVADLALDDKWEASWYALNDKDEPVLKSVVDGSAFTVLLQRSVKLHFVLDEYGTPADRYAEVVAKYGSTLSTVDLKDQTGTSVTSQANGYRFAGWYATADYSGASVSLDSFTANLSDLYAKWEKG